MIMWVIVIISYTAPKFSVVGGGIFHFSLRNAQLFHCLRHNSIKLSGIRKSLPEWLESIVRTLIKYKHQRSNHSRQRQILCLK